MSWLNFQNIMSFKKCSILIHGFNEFQIVTWSLERSESKRRERKTKNNSPSLFGLRKRRGKI